MMPHRLKITSTVLTLRANDSVDSPARAAEAESFWSRHLNFELGYFDSKCLIYILISSYVAIMVEYQRLVTILELY